MVARKSDFKPLFWITGNYYDSQCAWNLIKSKMADAKIVVVDCGHGGSAASDVILLLKNKNLFNKQSRIIKLKGVPEDYAEITDYLRYVNNDTVLVVDGPVGYYSKPPSNRLISAAASKFYKTFSGSGKVFEFDEDAADDGTAKRWVSKVVTDLGRKIDDDAAFQLVMNAGLNYDTLYSCILKLLDYSTKTISKKDVEDCVSPDQIKVIWNIIDLLDRKQFDLVFCELQKFYEKAGTTTGTFRGEMESYYGALTQHYDFLTRTKDACPEALNYATLSSELSGIYKIGKDKDGEAKLTEMYDKGFINRNIYKDGFKSAFKWPKSHAYFILQFLIQCRCSMRQIQSDAWHRMLLDLCFMFICGKMSAKQMQVMLSSQDAVFS